MKIATGECKFCQQMKTIEVPDSWDEDDVNAEVTRKCDCEEAVAAQKKFRELSRMRKQILTDSLRIRTWMHLKRFLRHQ